jgi:hypothetical protein
MSSTLAALMLNGNITLLEWNLQDDDDEKFAITLPGTPLTNDNYFDENPNCGHHVMNKAKKALGVVSPEGTNVVGAKNLEINDFRDLFRLDIDNFKQSENDLASLFGADSEKENKTPLLQGVYNVLKKGKVFCTFRQFAIELACTEPEGLFEWADPNLKKAHGAAILVLGELFTIATEHATPAAVHPFTKIRTAARPVRTGARKKTPPSTSKTASSPMSEAIIQNLIKKGTPEMSQWVVALQDVGTDRLLPGNKGMTTVLAQFLHVQFL